MIFQDAILSQICQIYINLNEELYMFFVLGLILRNWERWYIHSTDKINLSTDRDGLFTDKDGLFTDKDGLFTDKDGHSTDIDGLSTERDGLFTERDGPHT